jgi:hypothetical protein
MLKILTGIDKSQGYRKFDGSDSYKFGNPCILAGASVYLEISLSDIVPNATGLEDLKMPFVFIPTVNLIKVPVAGVSTEISDMVPGILREMQNSKILENMDLAVQAVNNLLPDPVEVSGIIDPSSYPSFKLPGNLSYYRLDTRYKAKKIHNPWPDLHQVSWFGQDLYVCTSLRDDNCYLTIMSSQLENRELLVQLMNYKYAFKRYGIKATSN